MEDHLYGRLTTLNRLKEVRDDPTMHPYRRLQADRSISKIQAQLKDKTLMRLRERLIRATKASDYEASWKIESEIRAYEGRYRQDEEQA